MVKTPGRPANLDGVEGNLQGGIRREEMRRSSPRGRGKTLLWIRGIQWFIRKEKKQATMEASTYIVRRASTADTSNDGLDRGVPGQYFCGGHTNCCKRRTTRGVSGKSGNISSHCRTTTARNKVSQQTDQCFEKKRDACRQHRDITRRETGGGDCMHTL